jgi:uncharacterized protein (TIGR00369 family)
MPDTAIPDHWPETERQIRARVGSQGFSNLVGAVLTHLAPGECHLSVTSRPELLQQHGYIHGGCIAFMVDNTTTVAAGTLLRPGQAVLTAEFKLNYLAPARGQSLVCRARVLKAGRTLTIVTADVFSDEDGKERHVATALATIAVVTTPLPGGA